MAEEITEVVQIIRVAYDGVEIAMKVGSGGFGVMKKTVNFFKGMLDYEKTLGKTSMKKLLLKGGDLQVLQFKTEDMKKVKKMAKKYGMLYSILPDINKKDGMSEVIFHTEAVPRANMLIQKLGFGKIANFNDYIKNGNQEELGKLMDFLQKQKAGSEKNIETSKVNAVMEGLIEKVGLFAASKQSIDVNEVTKNFEVNKEQAKTIIKQLETIGFLDKMDESGKHKVIMDKEAFGKRIRSYQQLAERMRAVSMSKDLNLSDVTISKSLIVNENAHAVKTRIPGTWEKDVKYIWINKENIMDINNGKTMLSFIDKTKDYKIYDEENRVIETIKGENLYTKHYDKVESSVRERYEQAKKQEQIKNYEKAKSSSKTRTANKATGRKR